MHLTSCGTLVILITSTGEFLLYFTVSFFLVSFHLKKKKFRSLKIFKKKKKFAAGLFFCCPISTAGLHVPVGLNCDQMEPPHEEQYSQERNLSAHRSMRDYRNSPWMNVPSCMVPPTNVPYENSYKPSWRNHLNLSWGPKPP